MSIAQNIKALNEKAGRFYATGKRKRSVAKVWLTKGKGEFKVNGKTVEEYLGRPVSVMVAKQPLEVTENMGKFDVNATVVGGGHSGQAGALRHGLSKALVEFSEEMKPALRKAGLMTRDSRVVESKKYGKRKARRSVQFSKR